MYSIDSAAIKYQKSGSGMAASAVILKNDKPVAELLDSPGVTLVAVKFATPEEEAEFIQAANKAGYNHDSVKYNISILARELLTQAEASTMF